MHDFKIKNINNIDRPDFQAEYPKQVSTWRGRIISVLKIIFFPLIIINWLFKKAVLHMLSPFLFGSDQETQNKNDDQEKTLGGEHVILRTPDKRLIEAQYIPCMNGKKTKIAILFTGSHRPYEEYASPYVNGYKEHGYDVLCVNYGGFGQSQGKPTAENLQLDAETAYQFVRKVKQVGDSDILVHGYSLGTYPGTYLCSQHPIGKYVFDRGFSKISQVVHDVAKVQYGFIASKIASLLTEYAAPLNNESLIDKVNGQILLVRGEYDITMLPHHEAKISARIQQNGQCTSYEAVALAIGHFNSSTSVQEFMKLIDLFAQEADRK